MRENEKNWHKGTDCRVCAESEVTLIDGWKCVRQTKKSGPFATNISILRCFGLSPYEMALAYRESVRARYWCSAYSGSHSQLPPSTIVMRIGCKNRYMPDSPNSCHAMPCLRLITHSIPLSLHHALDRSRIHMRQTKPMPTPTHFLPSTIKI